jgi:hypothetical protein
VDAFGELAEAARPTPNWSDAGSKLAAPGAANLHRR